MITPARKRLWSYWDTFYTPEYRSLIGLFVCTLVCISVYIFVYLYIVITPARIRLWSYWDTFYSTEYCDSQLFLQLTSHLEEAGFHIIILVIIIVQIHSCS